MTDANPEDIIKNARDKKGLTQQQVADFLGIGLRSYQHFEAGRFPAFKTAPIIALEKHLGIKIYDKIYGDKKVSHETATDEPDAQFNIPKGITFIETKDGANEYLRKRRELKNHSGPYMVPLVPVAAQASYAKNFYDMAYIEKLESYPILPGVDPHGASCRYFQVKGRVETRPATKTNCAYEKLLKINITFYCRLVHPSAGHRKARTPRH